MFHILGIIQTGSYSKWIGNLLDGLSKKYFLKQSLISLIVEIIVYFFSK